MDPADLGADIVIAKGPPSELGRIILSVIENPEENHQKCRMGQVLGVEDMWPRQITEELLDDKDVSEICLRLFRSGKFRLSAEEILLPQHH
jgi:hypothetical protein